jgi:hypothetical protein
VTAVTGYAARPLPAEGAWRVHPDPAALPQLSHEGSGRNRYDDPNGQSTVRYAAQNLTGALLETMARFRPNPEAERLLAQVAGIEDSDVEHADPTVGVADWLATQRVGRVHVAGDATLVDVHDPDLLRDMDKHPLVRAALEESGLGTALNPARLDQAVVRLGGPVGRPITQALSAAIRDWRPEIAGVAYLSRLDDQEWCWALWDTTIVTVEASPLDPNKRHHRRAAQHVAAALEIRLPNNWA